LTDPVRVVFTKFDGSLHWHAWLERLGEDEHGVWLGAPVGTAWQKGDETPVVFAHAHVSLFPRDAWWVANFNAAPADLEVYCDITDVPVWSAPDVVTMVDLDLDVIRIRGTSEIRVIDEDEFAEHQVRYDYPRPVVDRARAAADWLAGAVATREPFRTAYRGWLSTMEGR
jgi:protein associated with RNAse G/E